MDTETDSLTDSPIPNGSGAAAILAAGIGSFALGVFTVAGDTIPAIKRLFIFYKPTGPLSGVTTTAILIWLLSWLLLEWRWKNRTVPMGRVNIIAFTLLGLCLLLTFPPITELF
jgi:hypothetical protein